MSTTPLKRVTSDTEAGAADGNEARPAAEPSAKAALVEDAKAKPKKPKPKEVKPAGAEAPTASGSTVPVAQVKPKALDAKASIAPGAAKPAAAKPAAVKPAAVKSAAVKSAPATAESAANEANPEEHPSKPAPGRRAAPVVELPSGPTRDAAAAVRALRRARARRLGLRVAIGIGLPTVLASIYFYLVASSQYESVSMFMVNSADGRSMVGLETLIGAVPGGAATRDTLAVRDFIVSRDMIAVLERELHLSKHYEDPVHDWWSRLASGSSSENVYDYYRQMVQVDYDSNSGVLTLRVRAFSPKFAKDVSDAILSEGEKMVNQLSDRARADQTKLADGEVATAEARLAKARQAIITLQQQHGEFNPEASASEAFALRGELKGEMARARAELMEARAFMQPNAPRVVALEERVRSLSAQVSEESRRLVNPKSEKGLGNAMALFDAAMVEKEFAQGAYRSALTSLEVARSEASRQHRYLATISKPSIPNDETHPKRLRGVVTVVLMSAMLLGIASLLVDAVREHARI